VNGALKALSVIIKRILIIRLRAQAIANRARGFSLQIKNILFSSGFKYWQLKQVICKNPKIASILSGGK
jgi:hypothetical protein